MTDFDIARFILERFEGGYVNHAADRGGATNFGITLPTLRQWRGHDVDAEDIKALTKEEAVAILAHLYLMESGFFQIADWRLRLAAADFAVHSGVHRATVALQAIVGADQDGIFGRETGWLVARADAVKVREKLIAERLRHLGRLVTKSPSQAVFAHGWLNRVAMILEAA